MELVSEGASFPGWTGLEQMYCTHDVSHSTGNIEKD